MIEYGAFARILDGTGYDVRPHGQPSWKQEAYHIFAHGGIKIFYPDHLEYFKYLIDGYNKVIYRSIHTGSDIFVVHQAFDVSGE